MRCDAALDRYRHLHTARCEASLPEPKHGHAGKGERAIYAQPGERMLVPVDTCNS